MENSVEDRVRFSLEVKDIETAAISEPVLVKVAKEGSLPFDAEEPNELTARVIEEGEKGINEHRAIDVSDLFKQLGL